MPPLDPEMQRMQQDAVRRVREMQALVASKTTPSAEHPGQETARPEVSRQGYSRQPAPAQHASARNRQPQAAPQQTFYAEEPQAVSSQTAPAAQASGTEKPDGPLGGILSGLPKPFGDAAENILDTLMKDGERTLILILLLLLVEEKADSTLILALMYLLI